MATKERRPSLFDPYVEQYLLVDEGEFIVDEVVKHPVCMLGPIAVTLVGVVILFFSTSFLSWWWPVAILGLAVCCVGLWKFHELSMDRFVVTNMRVFRVNGVVNRHVATMPLTRILDISVYQPPLGILLKYGHFVFESAALDQGLHRITYVSHPTTRDLTIQRVIQRAGIRAMAMAKDLSDSDGS
ncbi:MAG: PH domain-containing protein [Propionibacteriaceae bacterium]|nr:PH domain-containing protein [Propionibacteriaceae bacterium]